MPILISTDVAVVIVGFRNAGDIRACLAALARAARGPSFTIFICENGGVGAFEDLIATLSAPAAPCAGAPEPVDAATDALARVRRLRLGGGGAVYVGEARGNLGYAGGVNAWARPLMGVAGWRGLWVLNPDTRPEPDALAELVGFAARRRLGMVGSRLVSMDKRHDLGRRGLRWRKLMASPAAVDGRAPVRRGDRAKENRRIDSPSGASVYLTRDCLERIGLMDERYFLYYEDLDWGLRAKGCGVGCADHSIVSHVGGTTIGSARSRAERSELSVYLEFRNRLIFVRRHYRRWAVWSAAVTLARAAEFLLVGSGGNFRAALRGAAAGLRGETGRPDHVLAAGCARLIV